MISIALAVLASIIGLLIYYVRAVSVLVDERGNIEKSPETLNRYLWLYRISERMESYWPTVKKINPSRWSKVISNVSLLAVFSILIVGGIFQQFLENNAGYILFSVFILSSLANGYDSLDRYHKLKAYMPVIFPALIYQSLTMAESQNPDVVALFMIPGYDYNDTKIAATFFSFILAFILPYPMAKFDDWFSTFISRSTLNFIQDFMRLSVKPDGKIEASVRKTAKETIAVTLKIILAVIGVLSYVSTMP